MSLADAACLSVFFVDNFDSFSFNLCDELLKRGAAVHVFRNDLDGNEALERALALPRPRLLVLSPGPGKPEDAGCCQALVSLARGKLPIFGVCLGLQALVQALGGTVSAAGEVVHGKAVWVEHDGQVLFAGQPSPLLCGRYHSLVATVVPPELEVTARCGELVMAVSDRQQPVLGVQFHPESILTPRGGQLIENVIRWAVAWDAASATGAQPSQGGAISTEVRRDP